MLPASFICVTLYHLYKTYPISNKQNKAVVTRDFDTTNERFQLAVELVTQTNRNIFLTGKAGTGKTTFLKFIRKHCAKQMAIVAPTGVAAINAGGVTLHSFFQLPLSPFLPATSGTGFATSNEETVNRHSLLTNLRLTDEKRKVLRQLELLIIDEISMVRCDILDAVDTVLRHIRNRPFDRFGGLQVLFIGDMFQLPPVIKDTEWRLLSAYYNGHYFFNSKVLEEEPPLYIEFNKIYRQRDENFISLLNQVRNNELDEQGIAILEKLFQPSFQSSKNDGYIILTTHNEKAREINLRELHELNTPLFTYEAAIKGDFPSRNYPADELLQLKTGAQVMFIRNDAAETGKRFYNGKMGTVARLEKEKIYVQCEGEPAEIEVEKEEWENIRYTLNKSTRQLEADVLGTFIQYPLRLAWAITIHKSQGLTFDKALIDAGEAFAPGQVYVALSRCTHLEGLVLKSRIKSGSLFMDRRIIEFSNHAASNSVLQEELLTARKKFQQATVISLFDFESAINAMKELLEYCTENNASFNATTSPWIEGLVNNMEALQDTAVKFHVQLASLFQDDGLPENNRPLQKRIKAGAAYFLSKLQEWLQLLPQSPAVTDSALHAREYNSLLREAFATMALKRYLLEGLPETFTMENFLEKKNTFILPSFTVNAYAGAAQQKTESPHPVLYQQLRKHRDTICSRKNIPIYLVAGSTTLDELARYLPQSLPELKKISGMGDAKINQYGQDFLDIILAYSQKNELTSLIHEKKEKKERKTKDTETPPLTKKKKGETQTESLRLYKEGKTIEAIAKERKLTVSTIETHVAHHVKLGTIKIEELVSPEKRVLIEPLAKSLEGGITAIKKELGDAVSFGEIKWVIASLQKKGTEEDTV